VGIGCIFREKTEEISWVDGKSETVIRHIQNEIFFFNRKNYREKALQRLAVCFEAVRNSPGISYPSCSAEGFGCVSGTEKSPLSYVAHSRMQSPLRLSLAYNPQIC